MKKEKQNKMSSNSLIEKFNKLYKDALTIAYTDAFYAYYYNHKEREKAIMISFDKKTNDIYIKQIPFKNIDKDIFENIIAFITTDIANLGNFDELIYIAEDNIDSNQKNTFEHLLVKYFIKNYNYSKEDLIKAQIDALNFVDKYIIDDIIKYKVEKLYDKYIHTQLYQMYIERLQKISESSKDDDFNKPKGNNFDDSEISNLKRKSKHLANMMNNVNPISYSFDIMFEIKQEKEKTDKLIAKLIYKLKKS